ncbi:MAG: Zn-dependent hydrolase [Chloroflexi bacterium]|nr:Zn-dependent hydrolase [Chloroflexota bacterium]MCY3582202.1 Zn-dependent hydrolase [Chloroflexota bacterium]MCY3715852.1 Zn-dependent hydrolase [Chloroflexota bacterium]MDE2649912.1 Zn-dependent hydrolase [Chloroflexota bacterium]MXV94172.1 Zn-dependent hydrolase [Chloroflexota bacterium]
MTRSLGRIGLADMNEHLRVDGARLWQSIMQMADIGATANGGSHRLTLSDEDKAARDLFAGWCSEAGLTMQVDELGDIFARREGSDAKQAPVAIGSHLDTQPFGGRFDGVFGVLAGLEVIRSLNDHGIATVKPLEVVNWTNEEGARFAPSMLASGVYGGVFALDWALARRAVDTDATLLDELRRIGYHGALPAREREFAAFIECHIEQGPILDSAGIPVGVVDAAQGFRWYDITLEGFASHTGSTPMVGRRNALLGMAKVALAVEEIAAAHAPLARGTVGSQVAVGPGSRNVIPGRVDFTVDLRHPSAATLEKMDAALRRACEAAAAEYGLELSLAQISDTQPVAFDTNCVAALERACARLGIENQRITSGAGHDACYVARRAPTAMLFAPCKDGISHHESESAEAADLEAVCNVLLHAALELAGVA